MFNRRSRKSDRDIRQASGVEHRPTQAEINRQLRSWTPRRIASWSLMLGGVLIAAQHLVAHAGFRPLPFSMGWQDLLVGYPMAALLALAGAILIDPRPRI
jgi:hypothetical protein